MCEVRHVDLYATDWIAGTVSLTLEERGLLSTAVMLIYAAGRPVEREQLRRACGVVNGRVFNRVLARLLALGKLTERDGMLTHERCEKELKNARKKLETWTKNFAKKDPFCGKSNTCADRTPPYAREREPRTESIDSSNLNSGTLGRSAPARVRAHEAVPREVRAAEAVPVAEPTSPTPEPVMIGFEEPVPLAPVERRQPEREEEAPLTDDERSYRLASLSDVLAKLGAKPPAPAPIRDPVAYEQAVGDAKWSAWLNLIHPLVGEHLTGDARFEAWEAIDTARKAGCRNRTPPDVRKLLNGIDKLRRAERRVAA